MPGGICPRYRQLSSDETKQISGQHSDAIDAKIEVRNYDAIVTRDNIALLETA